MINKPVIFFSFANSATAHLPLLKEESRQLMRAFSSLHDSGHLEVHREESITIEELPGILNRFNQRVCLFHYAGHADGQVLLLEDGSAHASGLAQLLSQQKENLALVFLNGCATLSQVNQLLELGVKAVIATSIPIEDPKATKFAGWFYQSLVEQRTLKSAFEYASAALQMKNKSIKKPGITELRGIVQQEEEDIPWGLYYPEGQPEVLNWRLTDAMENPFLGLPPLPATIGFPKKPFKGLDYFTRDEARIFFGRGTWVQDLYSRLTDKNTDPVLLLCGQSGVGKSSLLHAGLWPRLEAAGWEVNYCRKSHISYLAKHITQISREASGNTLWVFDQFEELITLHPFHSIEYLAEFIDKLKEAFPYSSNKILLSFRKEYVAEIEAELDKVEKLKDAYNRVYLEPIDRHGVIEVVKGLTLTGLHQKKYGLKIDVGLPELVANDITRDKQSNIAPALQILMTKMWEEAIQESSTKPHFRVALYERIKQEGLSLESHLRKVLEDLEGSQEDKKRNWVHSGLILDFLNFFVTPKLTAAEHFFEAYGADTGKPAIKKVYGHIEELLSLILFLQDKFLLTENAGDGASQPRKYRLAHDALGPVVRNMFDASELPGQQAWRIINAKGGFVLEQGDTRRFSESDNEVIQKGLHGMPDLSEALKKKIEDDAEFYLARRKDDFDLAYTATERSIENLEYERALKSLHRAQRTRLYSERLYKKAVEIPFPLAFLKYKAKLEESIQLILSIPNGQSINWHKLQDNLKELPEENLFEEVKHWMQKQGKGLYDTMRKRFLPNLVEVPGGTFEMGIEGEEQAFYREGPAHLVSIDPFKIADTPVTFWQYGLYCLDTKRDLPRDSGFGRGNRPVINLSWYEAIAYTNWLSKQCGYSAVYRLTELPSDLNDLHQIQIIWEEVTDWGANGFRLPTEAEWEFAASAKIEKGCTELKKWRFGNGKDTANPDEINFDASSLNNSYAVDKGWMKAIEKDRFLSATTPVKQFAKSNKNPFGLHEMSGNVYDWCWDRFSGDLSDQPDKYFEECKRKGTAHNPRGAKSGDYRVVRGGSWIDLARGCRSCYRYRHEPIFRYGYIGFRIARS